MVKSYVSQFTPLRKSCCAHFMKLCYIVSTSFNIIMIDKLDATCDQYGMAMDAKKTKTMIVEKTPEKHCEVNVKVKQYKYLGTTVEHTGQLCNTKEAQIINQAKIAFWKRLPL